LKNYVFHLAINLRQSHFKVLIKRHFKEGYFKEIKHLLKEARYDAMDQEGYISSETLWDHENPFRVVVASNWRTIKDWNNWENSDLRKSIQQKFNELLDGEAEYEIFEMGFSAHHLHWQ
jgi:heme-degrading monooxygenase HmoA